MFSYCAMERDKSGKKCTRNRSTVIGRAGQHRASILYEELEREKERERGKKSQNYFYLYFYCRKLPFLRSDKYAVVWKQWIYVPFRFFSYTLIYFHENKSLFFIPCRALHFLSVDQTNWVCYNEYSSGSWIYSVQSADNLRGKAKKKVRNIN